MSKKHLEERSIARMEKRPSAGSEAQVVEDPISIGLDRTITIDLARLPTPEKIYDADFAWIEHRPGSVSLFFGKASRDDPGALRTRLEVRYPPENLVQHFWKNSREFHAGIAKFAAQWPADETRAQIDASTMKSPREHSEWANFESMAHAGSEASIDFYLMPASGIARFARGQGSGGLKFAPIVRVHLTVFELLRLLDSAAEVVETIKQYLPKAAERTGEIVEERA